VGEAASLDTPIIHALNQYFAEKLVTQYSGHCSRVRTR